MRRIRRITVRIVVLLLLGAVVNVALAASILNHWGWRQVFTPEYLGALCALNAHDRDLWNSRFPTIKAPAEGRSHSELGACYRLYIHVTNEISVGSSRMTKTQREHWYVLRIVDLGWPMHSCGAENWYDYQMVNDQPVSVPLTPHESTFRIGNTSLPSRLVFPGFLINTLFYAAVLWLLLFAPFAARRMIRRRRGRCPQCGYSLEGITSDKCPECGKERPA